MVVGKLNNLVLLMNLDLFAGSKTWISQLSYRQAYIVKIKKKTITKERKEKRENENGKKNTFEVAYDVYL